MQQQQGYLHHNSRTSTSDCGRAGARQFTRKAMASQTFPCVLALSLMLLLLHNPLPSQADISNGTSDGTEEWGYTDVRPGVFNLHPHSSSSLFFSQKSVLLRGSQCLKVWMIFRSFSVVGFLGVSDLLDAREISALIYQCSFVCSSGCLSTNSSNSWLIGFTFCLLYQNTDQTYVMSNSYYTVWWIRNIGNRYY